MLNDKDSFMKPLFRGEKAPGKHMLILSPQFCQRYVRYRTETHPILRICFVGAKEVVAMSILAILGVVLIVIIVIAIF